VSVADDDHHADTVRAQQIPPEVVTEVEAVEPGGEHERPCKVNLPISHRNHPDIGRRTDGSDPVARSLGQPVDEGCIGHRIVTATGGRR